MKLLDGSRLSLWIDAIGWALVHSLWAGAAVALALAFVLRLLHPGQARARYGAACAAMVLLAALPACALWRSHAVVLSASVSLAPDRALPRLEPSSVSERNAVSPDRRPWHGLLDGPRPFFPAVVAVWAAGVALCALRLLGGWVQARRWVRLDTRPCTDSVIDRLSARMGVRYRVALLQSCRIEVPMVVGWLRPAILVPVAALSGLTALELEAILAHELAHIRRHDYLVNLLQCLIETVMFHHPATWWISRVIRREREHCCDDIAISTCRDRLAYARALAAVEGLRVPAFSLSPAASGGNLLARIRRVLNPVEKPMKPVRRIVAILAVVALVPIWLVRAGVQTAADPRSDILDKGRQKVIDFYQANGFFEAKASVAPVYSDNSAKRDLKFVISQGTQYKVRNLIIEGNHRIKTEALRKDLELHSGKPFRMAVRDADKNRMLIQYREIGCIDAQVECEPRFTNQQGVVDLVYRIDERQPCTLGEFEIVANDRNTDKVARREAVEAGLVPGEILDKTRIEILRRRLISLGYFQNNPQQGALSKESRANSSLTILADDQGAPENPPSESEIFVKLPPMSTDKAGFHQVERTNARIIVEKIADKADPVKVYPLAGPCQLVHRHYKCTVYFDDVFRTDTPVPLNHVDHKVHVVYIDKDFLRRAIAPRPRGDDAGDPGDTHVPPAKSRDDRIDRIVREIEQLKRELQSDRQDQERVLDQFIKELESLKAHAEKTQSTR